MAVETAAARGIDVQDRRPQVAIAVGHRARTSGLVLAVPFILVIATMLRVWDLTGWPIFSDEDSYISTALVAARLPLFDAVRVIVDNTYKAPLLPLVLSQLAALGADPLLAGRAMSGLAGLLATVLTFELGRRLGGNRVGLIASALYAVSPMTVLHDRVTSLDSWLTALALAATLASVSAVEHRSGRFALVAALAGALAVQAKVPGLIVAAAPIVALFVARRRQERPTVYAAVAMAGPALSYAALMASPIAQRLSEQNAMLLAPGAALGANLADVGSALWTYFPGGLALLMLPGAALASRRNPRLTLVSALLTAAWILPWVVLSKFAPTRYYLPAVPFLCAFAGMALVGLPALAQGVWARRVAAGVAGLLLIVSTAASVRLVVDHPHAALSQLDDWQYRSGWPAGYGYPDADHLVRAQAEPGSTVAYLVDMYHVAGAGLYRPLPAGVTSLGYLESVDALPTGVRLYVIVDDGRDRELVTASSDLRTPLDRVHAARPDLQVLGSFSRPGTDRGVTVLRTP
jgi:4-amino-4-deoxy-L-arabinose transferase-like glycosyltransferase